MRPSKKEREKKIKCILEFLSSRYIEFTVGNDGTKVSVYQLFDALIFQKLSVEEFIGRIFAWQDVQRDYKFSDDYQVGNSHRNHRACTDEQGKEWSLTYNDYISMPPNGDIVGLAIKFNPKDYFGEKYDPLERSFEKREEIFKLLFDEEGSDFKLKK